LPVCPSGRVSIHRYYGSLILWLWEGGLAFELNLTGNQSLTGCIRAKILKLPSGGLHVKHTEQRGIWVPTQHLLWDQGKPRTTLIELAGRRTFRMQTDF
jgi:hypothetical protein